VVVGTVKTWFLLYGCNGGSRDSSGDGSNVGDDSSGGNCSNGGGSSEDIRP
jgi:hypothetical protein